MKKVFAILLLLAVVSCAVFAQAAQEKYPTKPIDIVLASSAGSGGDVSSRLVAKYLGQELGVTVNVINTPGGSGIPAVQSVLTAQKDGYTLMSEQGLSSSYQMALDEIPYDLMNDRVFICRIVSGPQVICGNPKMGWNDIRDVAAYIKDNPGVEFLWGGIGKSSAANFAIIEFMNSFGIDMSKTKEVRYGGGGEILAAIAGGHIMIGSCAASGVPSFVQDGSVKPLVVCGSSRLESLPDVPCAAELGLTDLTADFWIGLSAPKGVSDEVIKTIEAAAKKVSENPEFIADLAKVGVVVSFVGTADMPAFIQKEGTAVKKMVKGE